jgi:Domain of unknown function (DUF1772)
MRQIPEFIAVLACSLFTGASVYINLVEHPARMECGVEIAATEFAPSYRRANIMQATLAAVGLLCSIAAWVAGATFWWVVAGALLGSVIPFTLIVILPTNKLLLSPTLDLGHGFPSLGRWVVNLDRPPFVLRDRAHRAPPIERVATYLPCNLFQRPRHSRRHSAESLQPHPRVQQVPGS